MKNSTSPMNCSTTEDIPNQYFLTGNLGASIFLATYIGLYGMGIIVYFACQFMTDAREPHENEIPTEFFSAFHQINERQEIYSKLKNKQWLKEIYNIYYSDQPSKSEIVEQLAEHCSKKYQDKIRTLQSRHEYYVT